MTPALWAVLIPALATFLTALAGYIQARRAAVTVHEVSGKVDEVAKSVNGRLDQLVQVTGDAAHAAGVEEQRARGAG